MHHLVELGVDNMPHVAYRLRARMMELSSDLATYTTGDFAQIDLAKMVAEKSEELSTVSQLFLARVHQLSLPQEMTPERQMLDRLTAA